VILVCEGPPAAGDVVLIERTATTLALGRLLTRHAESLERQAHRTLISGIITQAHADPAEAAVRSRALGVPVDGRQLIAVVLRLRSPAPGVSGHARVMEAADAAADACRAERIPALVGTLDDTSAGAMLSLPPRAEPDRALTGLASRIRERLRAGTGGLVIGVGAAVESIRDVRRSFLEATQVADVAAERGAGGPPFYRLPDLRLRGLLHLLRDDPRLQTFVERELGALLVDHAGLLDVLAAYLAAGGNKAEAAKRSHLARPTFYERLRRIERILGTDLDSPESRTSLHVALLALGAGRSLAAFGPGLVLAGGLLAEAVDLGLELAGLFLQLEDEAHSGQVEAACGQRDDLPEPFDVAGAVAARPSGGADRLEQALALVDAQGLRMHAGELGGDRDAEQAAVRLHPARCHRIQSSSAK
jgi:purine catabolism regulator